MRRRTRLVLGVVLLGAVVAFGGGRLPAGADATGAVRPRFADDWATSGSGDGNLQNPRGVAVNEDTGDVYVADTGNDRVSVWSASGTFERKFGTTGSLTGRMEAPRGIFVDAANRRLVADTGNDRLELFDPRGLLRPHRATRLRCRRVPFGSTGARSKGVGVRATWCVIAVVTAALVAADDQVGADANGAAAPYFADAWASSGVGFENLDNPRGVAVHPVSGDVYVADTANDRIVQYDSDGRFVRTFGATPAFGQRLDSPWDVAVSAFGEVFVADTGNHRVVKYNSGGVPLLAWGSLGSGNSLFRGPKGIALGPSNTVVVADTGNSKIKVYTALGTFQRQFGTAGSGPGQLRLPRDVAASASSIYVADTGNDRVAQFSTGGAFVRAFGTTGSGTNQLESPQGIFTQGTPASTTSVFVADTGNDRMSVWSSAGVAERRFGGTGSRNREMEAPRNVFVDQANRRYVIDSGNDRLQLFDPPVSSGIVGEITDDGTGVGIPNTVAVISDHTTFDLVAVAETGATGDFQIAVPSGTYAVAFLDPTGGHEFEYFNDQPDVSTAGAVPVAGAATRTDAALTPHPVPPATDPGTIAGRLGEPAGDAAGTWVVLVDSTGGVARAVQAGPLGKYRITDVSAGNYTLLFLDPRGVNATEFYDDTPDPTLATPVVVHAGATTRANAHLDP